MPAELSRWCKVTGGREFMRLGVGIDGEARRLSARRQSGPVPAVQPVFHLDSPSQAKDDSASRDNSPGSRRSAVSARTRSRQSHDPNIRAESNRFVAIPVMWR